MYFEIVFYGNAAKSTHDFFLAVEFTIHAENWNESYCKGLECHGSVEASALGGARPEKQLCRARGLVYLDLYAINLH